MNTFAFRLGLPIATALALWFIPVPAGLTAQAWHLFAITVAVILGFITGPFPTGAVALIGLTAAPLTGTLKTGEVLIGFSSSAIWLIVAAFFLSRAFIKTGLGRRVAYVILRAIGTSTLKVGYAFALTDLFLGMATPSSTARAGGILYPILISVGRALGSDPATSARRAGAYLLQTVYQIEGVVCAMFLTAMAANPMMVVFARQTAGIEITWSTWFVAASVPGLIGILAIPLIMYLVYPPELKKTPEARQYAAEELRKIGPMTRPERMLLGIFVGALVLWSAEPLIGLDATLVALLAVVAMLLFEVIDWKDVMGESGAWDTLIWMGTLVALAALLNSKGFIPWFAQSTAASLSGMWWGTTLGLLVVIYMYSQYAFASLTAHAAAMYAAFLAVAVAADAPPYLSALAMAFTANICFGLTHYSAGCGPIFFGSGYVPLTTWWRLGVIFSVVELIIWIGIGSLWWKILGLW